MPSTISELARLGEPPLQEFFGTTVMKHCWVGVPAAGLTIVNAFRLLSKFVIPQRESVVFCANAGMAAAQARNIRVSFAVFIIGSIDV